MPIANVVGLYYNAICSPENSHNDGSGNGYTLQPTGSPAFQTSAFEGSYSVLPSVGGGWIASNTGNNGLNAALSVASFTFECYFYLTSLAGAQALFTVYSAASNNWGVAVNTNGSVKIYYNGNQTGTTSAGVVTTGVWYYCAATFGAAGNKLWISPAASISQTPVLDTGTTGTTGAWTSMQVGRRAVDGGELMSAGYIDSICFSNVARSVFPTLKVGVTPSAAAVSSSEIDITWTDETFGLAYAIYRNTVDDPLTAIAAEFALQGDQTVRDRGLTAGTQYFYWVRTIRTNGLMGGFSASATATTSAAIGAPTALAAGTPTADSLTVTWTDPASVSYVLIYKNTVNNSATATLTDAAAAGVQQATICDLTAGTDYYFWAKAVGADGQVSAFSSVATGTTSTGTAPAAPTAITCEADSSSAISLTWTDGAGTAYMVVLRSTTNSLATAEPVGAVDAGTQAFTDTGLAASTQYFYWLRPFNSLNEAGPEGATSATTEAAPTTPVREDRDYLGPLQKAVFARLQASALTYTDNRVQPAVTRSVKAYGIAPEDAEPPFILTGEISSQEPKNTKNRRGQLCIYTVHVISEYRGHKEASEIANKVMKAISASKLDLSADGLVIAVQKGLNVQARELPDAYTIDWAVQISLEIYETATVTIGGA